MTVIRVRGRVRVRAPGVPGPTPPPAPGVMGRPFWGFRLGLLVGLPTNSGLGGVRVKVRARAGGLEDED